MAKFSKNSHISDLINMSCKVANRNFFNEAYLPGHKDKFSVFLPSPCTSVSGKQVPVQSSKIATKSFMTLERVSSDLVRENGRI